MIETFTKRLKDVELNALIEMSEGLGYQVVKRWSKEQIEDLKNQAFASIPLSSEDIAIAGKRQGQKIAHDLLLKLFEDAKAEKEKRMQKVTE